MTSSNVELKNCLNWWDVKLAEILMFIGVNHSKTEFGWPKSILFPTHNFIKGYNDQPKSSNGNFSIFNSMFAHIENLESSITSNNPPIANTVITAKAKEPIKTAL